MKALVLEQPGPEPRLALRDLPEPSPGRGEVVVQVEACGLCHHDLLVMSGVLRRGVKPGVVLGHEIAGRVIATGKEVTSLEPGQRVISLLTEACGSCQRCRAGREHRCLEGLGIGHGRDGGFAQRVKLRAFALVPLPTDLEPAQTCLLACPIGVVVKGVGELARPRPGERVLVTGAGGGLGVHALQLARAAGAAVLALTSSPAKVERLQALGAHEVVLMGELDFSEVVRALTEDRGAAVIVDTVGSPLYPSLVRCLAQDGRLLSLGEVAGEGAQINLAELIFRDATLVATSGADRRHVLEALAQVREGLLRPVVAQTMPLERAAEAYKLVRQRAILGRIVLVPPT